jgi:hypothetical protein
VEQVGGLQTQYAPSGYVGLWTRVARFQRDDLTRALEDRSLIQASLMRTTIHIVSRREYWLLRTAYAGVARNGSSASAASRRIGCCAATRTGCVTRCATARRR